MITNLSKVLDGCRSIHKIPMDSGVIIRLSATSFCLMLSELVVLSQQISATLTGRTKKIVVEISSKKLAEVEEKAKEQFVKMITRTVPDEAECQKIIEAFYADIEIMKGQ